MSFKKMISLFLIVMLLCIGLIGCNDNSEEEEEEQKDPIEEYITNTSGLFILQVYGVGNPDLGGNVPALSHSFVEIYNPTDDNVNLTGYSLQYSAGDNSWEKLELSGIIKSHCSYLVLVNNYGDYGVKQFNTSAADKTWSGIIFANKGLKVCLVESTEVIDVVNPYDSDGEGTKISGYVDMLGAAGKDASIDGAEGNYIVGQSKQKALRRTNVTDTNNNAADFTLIDYSSLSSNELDAYFPRNSATGSWDPFAEIEEESLSAPVSTTIIILQVYGTGGSGNDNTTSISNSFVELYNMTDQDIDLSGYSLQYCSNGTTWQKLDLEGTIKAHSSFLIVGILRSTSGNNYTIDMDEADMIWDIYFDNKQLKMCLVSNTDLITVANPYSCDDEGNAISGYVDMVGAADTTLDGSEMNPILGLSKQKSARRITITDSNNNSIDFEILDYRSTGLNAEELELYSPKNSTYGEWNPFN